MNPLIKGLMIAVLHVAIVASLGAKLLYDRSTQPRVWALTAPYDPNLPIRGRYVSLRIVVESRGIAEPTPGTVVQPLSKSVILRVEADRLVAEADPQQSGYDPSALRVQFIQRRGEKLAVLEQRVAFFIPEHIPDPSIRKPDEELWVEVTIPKKGPPRPIRLGVKKADGPIAPLEIG